MRLWAIHCTDCNEVVAHAATSGPVPLLWCTPCAEAEEAKDDTNDGD